MTTVQLETADDIVSHLLEGTAEALDIPPQTLRRATELYEHLGSYLAEFADDRGGASWAIYPQGSLLIGTAVRPIDEQANSPFDVDLVCRHDVDKASITKADLKNLVGESVMRYQLEHGSTVGMTSVQEGKRCWTAHYRADFHMDILPAIPSTDSTNGKRPDELLISDRTLSQWLVTNPKAFADWFRQQSVSELLNRKSVLAAARDSTVDDIPDWEVKTTLQRTVQVLKCHRDVHFVGELETFDPPSILITTMAAQAYAGEISLAVAVEFAAQAMLDRMGAGPLSVMNPVCETEDFTDRWAQSQAAQPTMINWLSVLLKDLSDARSGSGIQQVTAGLERSFGPGVRRAAAKLGDDYHNLRTTGQLSVAGPATSLTTATGTLVRPHRFYGS